MRRLFSSSRRSAGAPGQRIVGKVLGGYLGPDEVILVFFSWGAGVEPSLRPCGFSRVAGVEIRGT